MALVVTSLSGANSAGTGTVASFDKPRLVVMQLTTTGSPSGSIALEGSLDGVTYFSLVGSSLSAGLLVPSTSYTFVLFARANLTSISGGSVTAIIAASD